MKKIILSIMYVFISMSTAVYAKENVKVNDFPKHFNDIDPIQLQDVMLRYFDSTPTGIVSYNLEDVSKASGHMCPAILGAFLMTRNGLAALTTLYQESPDVENDITSYNPDSGLLYRGGIKVTMSGEENSGSAANAIGDVISYITGAKGADGFKMGPDFPFANRRYLMRYDDTLAFNPKTGIEVIFTSMKARYQIRNTDGQWIPTTFDACKGTWGDCKEITECDRSVKVTYRFKSPEIIGANSKASWAEKVKNILDNADKAITVEIVKNPTNFCSQ